MSIVTNVAYMKKRLWLRAWRIDIVTLSKLENIRFKSSSFLLGARCYTLTWSNDFMVLSSLSGLGLLSLKWLQFLLLTQYGKNVEYLLLWKWNLWISNLESTRLLWIRAWSSPWILVHGGKWTHGPMTSLHPWKCVVVVTLIL